MSDERVVIARVVLPPGEEHCYASMCGQKACCNVEVRVDPADWEAVDEEEVYVFPLCAAHAHWTLQGVLELATKKFPADIADVPPWEQSE